MPTPRQTESRPGFYTVHRINSPIIQCMFGILAHIRCDVQLSHFPLDKQHPDKGEPHSYGQKEGPIRDTFTLIVCYCESPALYAQLVRNRGPELGCNTTLRVIDWRRFMTILMIKDSTILKINPAGFFPHRKLKFSSLRY